MEEVHKKNKLTQWGSHILTSILTSQMMVTKNPQNVQRKYFWAILMTFISEVKIDINMCEPHYVNLFFLWTSSIVQMFDYLTFDIFLTTWHFDTFNLNHLSPHRAIFSILHRNSYMIVEWQLHACKSNKFSRIVCFSQCEERWVLTISQMTPASAWVQRD